jgi:hypothetical protein
MKESDNVLNGKATEQNHRRPNTTPKQGGVERGGGLVTTGIWPQKSSNIITGGNPLNSKGLLNKQAFITSRFTLFLKLTNNFFLNYFFKQAIVTHHFVV